MEPTKVRPQGDLRYAGVAFEAAADPGAQQALGGEQRHLRGGGDPPEPAIGFRVTGDAAGTEAFEDLGAAYALHGCAQRISGRAAQQASAKSVSVDGHALRFSTSCRRYRQSRYAPVSSLRGSWREPRGVEPETQNVARCSYMWSNSTILGITVVLCRNRYA